MSKTYKWDTEQLTQWYWEEEKTPDEIGKIIGCPGGTVRNTMVRLGIPRRTTSEAGKLSYRKDPTKGKGNKGGGWRGGKRHEPDGYISVWLSDEDPYAGMRTKDKVVLEHRLVMARHLGRPLSRLECVHHLNGIKDDNRFENLELFAPTNHKLRDAFCHSCPLRKEIRLLQWQIKELIRQNQGTLV